jgi:hypothetical protein
MSPNRNKSAWMWLAVAAMAVVSLARVQADVGDAPVYANPVLAFLAGHESSASPSATGAPFVGHSRSTRKASNATPAWIAIVPVLFVGLVAPLSLISPRSFLLLGRTPSFPELPEKFQRPPPALL